MITLTDIQGVDDFKMLAPKKDAIRVNNIQYLFMGMRGERPVVIRRAESGTAIELALNPNAIQFSNGTIKAIGPQAADCIRYSSMYGDEIGKKWDDVKRENTQAQAYLSILAEAGV